MAGRLDGGESAQPVFLEVSYRPDEAQQNQFEETLTIEGEAAAIKRYEKSIPPMGFLAHSAFLITKFHLNLLD